MPDSKKYLDADGLLYFWAKIGNKFVAKEAGKGLSTNDFTTALKDKLDGIDTGATKVIVDSTLSSSSANPVENRVINSALNDKVSKVAGKGLSTNDLTDALKQTYDKAVADLAALFVPSKTSDLVNDSNFPSDANYVHTDNNFTTAFKNKLNGVEAGAQLNIIEEVQVNGTALTPSSKTVNVIVPTDNSQLTNGAGYQNATDVDNAISARIGSTYKAAGTITFANRPTLSASIEGYVYNVSDAFVTTSDFVEGAGKSHPAGTNIVCLNTSKTGTAVYKWDVLAGFVDLSNYVEFDDLNSISNEEIDIIITT